MITVYCAAAICADIAGAVLIAVQLAQLWRRNKK